MFISKFSTTQNFQNSRSFWGWALTLLSVFALFRFPGFGVPLFEDELATVSLWGQMPYLKILSNYQYPNNHIFLSLVLSFLLKTFGLKEWLLRVPLLICGAVSVYLGYRLGKRISRNAAVGFFTAFLMTISEQHIYYSTNGRGYIVITMLALLAVNLLFDRLEGCSFKIQKFPDGLNRGLALFGWLGIWLVGTWTVPTFLFFEVSIAIFLAGLMLAESRLPSSRFLTIPLVACLVGGAGFYWQYYVVIDSTMLAEATFHAAKTSLPLFFPELMAEWISPFEQAGILFSLLALMGLGRLLQQNRIAGILMACVWLAPLFMGIAGFLSGKLPGVPPARAFFNQQPFFLILGVIGAREAGIRLLTWIKRKFDFDGKGTLALAGVLAAILLLISCLNFFQHIYPQRLARKPWHKVHDFVKKLGSHDLLLVSHAMHVEFFLYGSGEMRQRIENILHEEKLGRIYFLEYRENSVSLNQELEKGEKRFLNFPALTRNAGEEGPTLPEKAVEVAAQFGPFIFYRLKEGWLQPLQGWEKVGLSQAAQGPYRWEKVSGPLGVRPLLRFEDSFTLAMESKKPLFFRTSAWTLNLVEVAGNDRNFSVAVVGGQMKDGGFILDPSWLANAWMIDHPYGSDIYNRNWNPVVFISQGAGPLSVIDVKFVRHPGQGAFRNFLSYRIDEPEVEKQ